VDYGAALEMRFGATRRGFESRPLRHTRSCLDGDSGVDAYRRADDGSIEPLRDLAPVGVNFPHDRVVWAAPPGARAAPAILREPC
jgi:hypothetical protein